MSASETRPTGDDQAIDPWLEKVYHAGSSDDLMAHYDNWATAYEQDLMAAGYRYLGIAGAFFGRHVPVDGQILDAGCGTGLMGEALAGAGYHGLVGLDPSAGMLDVARGKGCYERLIQGFLDSEIDGVEDASFDAAVALGVLTPGHAPPSSLEGMVRAVRPGGILIFSITTPAWEEGGFREAAEALDARGAWERLEATPVFRSMPYSKTEGELTCRIYVYRRT